MSGQYGFCNDGVSSSTANVQDVNARDAEKLLQRKPKPIDPKKRGDKRKVESRWFYVEKYGNTNISYVWFPPNIITGEFIHLIFKFCIIMIDLQKNVRSSFTRKS